MIFVMQDLHERPEEPFFSTSIKTLEYIFSKMESGDTLIQTGDFFHTSRPYPSDYKEIMLILDEAIKRGIKIIILAGNHDYNYEKKSYSIEPFEVFDLDIQLIKEPMILPIEDKNFLFLPWLPTVELKKKYKVSSLKEYYEEKIKEYYNCSLDYVIYHFEDETVFMGGVNTGINLTSLENKNQGLVRIGGHVHLQSENYLGTPFQTRYDEIDQIGRYLIISNDYYNLEYKDLPTFHVYLNIDYKEDTNIFDKNIKYILTIKNAPSVSSAYEKFKLENTYIRKVELNTSEKREVLDSVEEQKSMKEFMSSFVENNKVDKRTSSYLLQLL